MSVNRISAMLKNMDFSFTKAIHSLANANEDAQIFFKTHTFAVLKNQVETEEIEHLLFEDKSIIR